MNRVKQKIGTVYQQNTTNQNAGGPRCDKLLRHQHQECWHVLPHCR